VGPIAIKMKTLSEGMNTRIGSAAPMDTNGLIKN
jgi:hypothetical protein